MVGCVRGSFEIEPILYLCKTPDAAQIVQELRDMSVLLLSASSTPRQKQRFTLHSITKAVCRSEWHKRLPHQQISSLQLLFLYIREKAEVLQQCKSSNPAAASCIIAEELANFQRLPPLVSASCSQLSEQVSSDFRQMICTVLWIIALCLMDMCQEAGAVPLLRHIKECWEQRATASSTPPKELLECMSMLGCALAKSSHGQSAEAVQILADARAQCIAADAEGPATIMARAHWAQHLGEQGQHWHEAALAELRQIEPISQAMHGATAPCTLMCKAHLAQQLSRQGQHQDAVAKHQETVGAEALPPAERLASMTGLAEGLGKLGRDAEAAQVIVEAQDFASRTMGPYHPRTQRFMARWADELTRQDSLAQAADILQTLLAAMQSPEVSPAAAADAVGKLAFIHAKRGEAQKAEALLRQHQEYQLEGDREEVKRLRCMCKLGLLLGCDPFRRHEEAAVLLRTAYSQQEQMPNLHHEHKLDSAIGLACQLAVLQQQEEAVCILRKALPECEREQYQTTLCMRLLGEYLNQCGQARDSEQLLRRALKLHARMLEQGTTMDFLEQLVISRSLASSLSQQSKHEEAMQLLQSIVPAALEAHAADDDNDDGLLSYAEVLAPLAMQLAGLHQHAAAAEMLRLLVQIYERVGHVRLADTMLILAEQRERQRQAGKA